MRTLLLAIICCSSLLGQHTYWRLITLTSASSFPMVGQWVSYDASNSVISTSGSTASASNAGFGAASNVTNGATNCASFWQGSVTTAGQWIEIQFGSPAAVDHIGITSGCNGGYGLVDFSLQFSDNNSSWTTANSWYGATNAGAAITYLFTPANAAPTTLGIAWRLNIASGGSGCWGINNLKFFDRSSSLITTSNYATIASSTFGPGTGAWGALFPYASQGWDTATGGPAATYEYDFPTAQGIGSISFSNTNIGGCIGPTTFTTDYSYDKVTWVTTDTFTPGWSGGQTKTFTVSGGPGGFVPSVGVFVVGQ